MHNPLVQGSSPCGPTIFLYRLRKSRKPQTIGISEPTFADQGSVAFSIEPESLYQTECLRLCSNRTKPCVDNLPEKPDPSGYFRPIVRLFIVGQPPCAYKGGEPFDIFQQKDWVVNKFFVAFVTEHDLFPFVSPGANGENAITNILLSVLRAPKESFSDVMMLRCM